MDVEYALLDMDRLLPPEERVLLVLRGVPSEWPHILVVTTQRVLLLGAGGPRPRVKREVPAHAVRGVRYRPGIFTRVHIEVADAREIVHSPAAKAEAEQFADDLTHLIRTGRVPD